MKAALDQSICGEIKLLGSRIEAADQNDGPLRPYAGGRSAPIAFQGRIFVGHTDGFDRPAAFAQPALKGIDTLSRGKQFALIVDLQEKIGHAEIIRRPKQSIRGSSSVPALRGLFGQRRKLITNRVPLPIPTVSVIGDQFFNCPRDLVEMATTVM